MGMKTRKFKKIIVFFGIFALFFSIGFASVMAAEAVEGEAQAQEQEVVTIDMKVAEFLNKWMTPTVSGLLGLAGSFLGYFLYKRKYRLIENSLLSGVHKTEEARKLANEELEVAKKQCEQAKKMFEEEKEHYLALIETQKEQIAQVEQIQLENRTFKEILACIIASTPELAKNGYSRKLLLLLEEGDKFFQNVEEIVTAENEGGNDGTNNN